MYGKDERVEIGRRLQQVRGARDQRTFAEAVGSVQQTISKYERGEIPRSWLFLARLAEEEGINLNDLLTGIARRAGEGPGQSGDSGRQEGVYEGNGHGKEPGRRGAVEEGSVFAGNGGHATARF